MKASRGGAGAKIVANKSMPVEERRKHLEQMLLALDKTPTDEEQLKLDLLRTSGKDPATIAAEMQQIEQEREGALAAKGLPTKKEEGGLLGRSRGKAKPIKTPKEVAEEDLKKMFAFDSMQDGGEAAPALSSLSSKDAGNPIPEAPEIDDPAPEAENKGPPKMIPGHELLGDVPV